MDCQNEEFYETDTDLDLSIELPELNTDHIETTGHSMANMDTNLSMDCAVKQNKKMADFPQADEQRCGMFERGKRYSAITRVMTPELSGDMEKICNHNPSEYQKEKDYSGVEQSSFRKSSKRQRPVKLEARVARKRKRDPNREMDKPVF